MILDDKQLKIKLIKPFYGHDNWRTKPLAIGRVLNYGSNPKRGRDLIRQGIAVEYRSDNK